MTNFNEMKSNVVNALQSAVAATSQVQAKEALGVYLDQVAKHLYGTPTEISAALVEAIEAGLITPEDVLFTNDKATARLVEGVFWNTGYKGDGSTKLALLLLPHAPKKELQEALGLRWCLNGRRVAEKLLPFVNEYSGEGRVRIKQIRASAAELLRRTAEGRKVEASHSLVQEVVSVVEAELTRLANFVLYPGSVEFINACRETALEVDPLLYPEIPQSIIEGVFSEGSHAASRIRHTVTSCAKSSITEILGKLSAKLASDFEVEKPSFDEWACTESGQEFLKEATGNGMDVTAGVAEEGSVDESKTFIIFESWNQLHALERHIDLDSVDHGFSDEYRRCDCGGCNIAVRTKANGWGWQPGYLETEGGLVLLEHAEEGDIEEYLSDRINNAQNAVNCPGLDISVVGFKTLEDGFESGWHHGQTDDPKAIMAGLRKKFPKAEFLFRIDGVGQFDMNFSIWVRGDADTKSEQT